MMPACFAIAVAFLNSSAGYDGGQHCVRRERDKGGMLLLLWQEKGQWELFVL